MSRVIRFLLVGIMILSGLIPFAASHPSVRAITLTNGGVSPATGNTTTLFTFQVKYIDSNNTPPTAVYVYIDGQPHSMWCPGYNYTTGEWCYYWTRLSAGNHSYYFTAINSNGSYRLPSSGNYTLYVAPHYVPPRITLTSGLVTPRQGNTSTNFTFSVRYVHNKGWSPTFVNVVIDGVARNMSVPQENFSLGVSCTYTTNLSLGDHSYYFLASTPNTTGARYPSSGFLHVYVSNHLRRRIWICNNNELLWYVRTNGFRGNGTQDDPFIIENFEINMSSGGGCIYISNTTYYVVLRNLTLHHTELSYSSFSRNTTIYLENVRYFRIEQCELYAANVGIYLKDCGDVYVKDNDFADGYPHRGMIGIYADNVDSLVVEDNTFRCSFEGVRVYRGRYITINSNRFNNPERDASLGISLYNGTNNVSLGMNLLKSIFHPLRVVNSHGITIFANNLSHSIYGGLYVRSSYNLTVTNNTLYNNAYGVYLTNSRGVHVYSNSFLNNSVQAWDDGTANSWNTYYPLGGNYWSDYSGRDNFSGPGQNISGSDGIGDTPYRIPGGNNYDNYPILSPPTAPSAYLYSGGVSPSSGNTSTLFTFFVYYSDESGAMPQYVTLVVDSEEYSMSSDGGDVRRGIRYVRELYLEEGTHQYFFRARSHTGALIKEPSAGHLNVTVLPPISERSALEGGGVTPPEGDNTTHFTFYVTYRNPEGVRPIWVKVHLTDIYGRTVLDSLNMTVPVGDFSKGVNCTVTARLPSGMVYYYFEALDPSGWTARYPEGGLLQLAVHRPGTAAVLANSEASPRRGSLSTLFTFQTFFRDVDGKEPLYVYVFLEPVEAEGREEMYAPMGYRLNKLYESLEGTCYGVSRTITLQSGYIRVWFEAMDWTHKKVRDPPEGKELIIYLERGEILKDPEISPGDWDDLNSSEAVNISIVYINPSGRAPDYVAAYIDGVMYGMQPTGRNYTRGVSHFYITRFTPGNHTLYFEAKVGEVIYRCPEEDIDLYVMGGARLNHPPQLTGGVRATEKNDSYVFYATYLDTDWDPPESVTLHIDGDTFRMKAVSAPLWGRGVTHEIMLNLSPAVHRYYFTATDSAGGFCRYPLSGDLLLNVSQSPGGESTPSPPVAVIHYRLNDFNVLLDGSHSYDPNGHIVQYTWVVDGQEITGMVIQRALTPGYHRIVLTVMDSEGLTDSREVNLLVGEGGVGRNVRVAGSVNLEEGNGEVDANKGYNLKVREVEVGRAVIGVSSAEGGAGFVVIYVNRSLLGYGEVVLTVDGKKVKRMRLEEIANRPDTPGYAVIEVGGELQVILYLPEIESHTVVISCSSKTGERTPPRHTFPTLLVLFAVLLLAAAIGSVLAISRRKHTGGGFLLSDENITPFERNGRINWDEFVEE